MNLPEKNCGKKTELFFSFSDQQCNKGALPTFYFHNVENKQHISIYFLQFLFSDDVKGSEEKMFFNEFCIIDM